MLPLCAEVMDENVQIRVHENNLCSESDKQIKPTHKMLPVSKKKIGFKCGTADLENTWEIQLFFVSDVS